MARLQHTFGDVYKAISEFLNTTDNPVGKDLRRAKDLANRGYMRFLYPIHPAYRKTHVWSFLRTHASLGTVANQYRYQLPTDFDRLYSRFKHEEDQGYEPLMSVTPDWILSQRSLSDSESFPTFYAITSSGYTPETGQLREVWFHETPNGQYTLLYEYIMAPPKLVNATDVFVGGDKASEVILQMGLAVAEQKYTRVPGPELAMAKDMLTEMILSDTGLVSDTVGKLRSGTTIEFDRPLPPIAEDDGTVYPS